MITCTEKALLEITLAEQMDALVVAELTLRGEGGGGGTKMKEEAAVKKESIFARARQAGIEIERIVNGVCYGCVSI